MNFKAIVGDKLLTNAEVITKAFSCLRRQQKFFDVNESGWKCWRQGCNNRPKSHKRFRKKKRTDIDIKVKVKEEKPVYQSPV